MKRVLGSLSFVCLLLCACGDDDSAMTDAMVDTSTATDAASDVTDRDVGTEFDPSTLRWEDLAEPSAGPLMVWGALVAPIDERRALLFGGTSASRVSNTIADTTWLYTWEEGALVAEEIDGPGPDGRYCGCASYDPARDVVVLGGGRNFEPEVTLVPETWELDLATRTWTRVDVVSTPIGGLGCNLTYVNGATYWFGGANARRDLGAFGTDNKTFRYDPDVPEWVELDIAGPSARYDAHFVKESDESVLLFAGAQSASAGMMSDVWRFDGSAYTLLTDNDVGPAGRRVAWVVPAPGGFIAAGGFDAEMNSFGDMWSWNEGTWTELSQGAPERISFAAVLPGGPDSLGVMFSGYDGDGPVRAARELRLR